MSARYVDIIIDISHEAIDRVFEYRVPEELSEHVQIGLKVEVPFGKGNARRTGYIVGISEQPKWDVEKLKDIHGIITNEVPVEAELIRLAAWMRDTYGSTMYQALQTVMPVKKVIRPVEKKVIRLLPEEEESTLRLLEYRRKKNTAKARLLEALLEHGEIPWNLAKDKLNISASTFDRMVEEGTIQIQTYHQDRTGIKNRRMTAKEPELNESQRALVQEFETDYQNQDYKTYLLHGVTGSGKTEVYMHAIDCVLREGRQAIVLIPEIALTFQTVMRFQRHFGTQITILNSKMSEGERYDQYQRIQKGEVPIVIGPRSALFAPCMKLGLIIIDEEHENSYKSDNLPKYHARETAIKRAEFAHASVILGSATPSLTSYYQAQQGGFRLWELSERANQQQLPEVQIVDLRDELQNGNRSRFSYRLQELLADRLAKGQQSMIFMNRRGYSSFVSCRSCGEVVQCPHCQVSLTYHDHNTAAPKLICHYCGYEEPFIQQCRKCGSKLIGKFGSGTQQVEAELHEMFPEAGILRMDADTTKRKNGHETILSAFADGQADILVGTQMIVKGHDFPNVTLVGILAADLSLHSQDYMAGERTFDLLTQAAGRAGRGALTGTVVIQTYDPDNPVIQTAAAQDYHCFYENEIAYRMALKYPPIYYMMVVMVTGVDESEVEHIIQTLADVSRRSMVEQFDARPEQTLDRKLHIIGPASPVIGKIKDLYRRIFYIKTGDMTDMFQVKQQLEQYSEGLKVSDTLRIYYDLNPMNIY